MPLKVQDTLVSPAQILVRFAGTVEADDRTKLAKLSSYQLKDRAGAEIGWPKGTAVKFLEDRLTSLISLAGLPLEPDQQVSLSVEPIGETVEARVTLWGIPVTVFRFEEQIGALSGAVANAGGEIVKAGTALAGEVEDLKGQIDTGGRDLVGKLDALDRGIGGVAGKFDGIEGALGSVAEKVEGVGSGLGDKLDTVRDRLHDIVGKVDEVGTGVGGKVEELKTATEGVGSKVGDVEGRVREAVGRLTDVSGHLKATAESLARVDTASGRIATTAESTRDALGAALNDAGESITRRVGQVGQKLDQVGQSTENIAANVEGLTKAIGAAASQLGGAASAVREAARGISGFSVLTEQVVPDNEPRGGAPAAGRSLGQTVESALEQVLGWQIRPGDARGFAGALSQSFEVTEAQGRTNWRWTPRTYAVQTDLSGGISGAQASLYSRAREAIEPATRLLDGLYPLRVVADPQDVQALRDLIRSRLTELVAELGQSGGPRVARVDQLFLQLLGPGSDDADRIVDDADEVGGLLKSLRKEFGLANSDRLVNTIGEEQNLTNYRILADHLISLRRSWDSNRRFFIRTGDQPFFGTQLVLISRQLSVITRSVREARRTLNSVFIDPTEQQTLDIHFQDDDTTLTVDELLAWVSSFASEEGPALIEQGGKFAIQTAVHPTVEELRDKVRFAADLAGLDPDDPDAEDTGLPHGFFTSRVRRAMDELADQLDTLHDLTDEITHPIPSMNGSVDRGGAGGPGGDGAGAGPAPLAIPPRESQPLTP